MFRIALLRSARLALVAARPAIRPQTSLSSRILRATGSTSPTTIFQGPAVGTIRCYSAGGSLAKEEVEGRIMSLLNKFDKVNDQSKINPTAHFTNDLGLDSLDCVEVVMAIEEEFSIEIPDKEADAIHSVDQAVKYILSQPDAH